MRKTEGRLTLKLHRETLRTLETPRLRGVAGGETDMRSVCGTCETCGHCTFITCPDTAIC